jgi:hypothetical protein
MLYMDQPEGVRTEWGVAVVGRCQRAVGRLLVFDRCTFTAAFEELASSLPAPVSAGERVFLSDRLRSFTRRAGIRFHETFHQRVGDRRCREVIVDESDAVWARAGLATDPIRILEAWLDHFVTAFDSDHQWPDHTFRSFVTRPTSTHSTTKMLPE